MCRFMRYGFVVYFLLCHRQQVLLFREVGLPFSVSKSPVYGSPFPKTNSNISLYGTVFCSAAVFLGIQSLQLAIARFLLQTPVVVYLNDEVQAWSQLIFHECFGFKLLVLFLHKPFLSYILGKTLKHLENVKIDATFKLSSFKISTKLGFFQKRNLGRFLDFVMFGP